jgi:carbonic anhydrase/acetyltransferase-like protein (isoleucine patch superfamily)
MSVHRQRIFLTVNLSLAYVLGGWTGPNVLTLLNPDIERPTITKSAFVHQLAAVTGNMTLGERVYIAHFASIRIGEGQPIYIGDESIVQDDVVLHGFETIDDGKELAKFQVEVAGKKYSVYVGKRVSMAHQSQVHEPAKIGDDTIIAIQAPVLKAEVWDHVMVEPGPKIFGAKIASVRYVPTGMVVTKQAAENTLPGVTDDYPFKDINKTLVHVNTQLTDGYNGKKPAGKG